MAKNPHAVALGKIGGQAKGPRKARPPAHYARLAKIRAENRRRREKGER